MRASRTIRQGLWLPAELYLQPVRLAERVNTLASQGDELSTRGALCLARVTGPARTELFGLLSRSAVALAVPFALCIALSLAGMQVEWGGVALGVALGVAFGVANGVASGVALGVAIGVAGGIASGIASGIAIGFAGGVAFGDPDGGVATGVAGGVAFGAAAFGVASGVASVVSAVVSGIVSGIVFGVVYFRLLLVPFEVPLAWRLNRSVATGTPASRAWARHPARWDPHGRYPLPGLSSVLAELQLHHPALAVEATRTVVANPSRRSAAAGATLVATERTVQSVATVESLASLASDLNRLTSPALLDEGERAEVALLGEVSQEVAASLAADSATNRVVRLRAAGRRMQAPNPGSAVIARHRSRLDALVDGALAEAEAEQRQREPVPQVYRLGAPLDVATDLVPTTFKGRRQAFERLEALLGGDQRDTVLLHGPRRYGKTSILKQLPARLGPSAIPVFVDLQGNLGAAESAATLLGGLVAEVVRQAGSHRGVVALPNPSSSTLAAEPYVGFARWLDEAERAIGDRHVLLCLDEYEKLEEQIERGCLDTRILDLIRNIAQHRHKATVLLSGVHNLTELPAHWASTLVSGVPIEVGPLERDAAAELVLHPVPGFPPVYAADAVDAIVEATARQPFLIQVLCSVLVEGLNGQAWREGDPQVSRSDVLAAFPKAVERAENYFLDVWQAQVPDPLKPLVRDLARGRSVVVDDGDELSIQALLGLERRRILTRATEGLAFVVPLFAEYVCTRQSLD